MKKRDGLMESLDQYFMRKFEELGIDAQALRIKIEELRIAEEGLKINKNSRKKATQGS